VHLVPIEDDTLGVPLELQLELGLVRLDANPANPALGAASRPSPHPVGRSVRQFFASRRFPSLLGKQLIIVHVPHVV
jgi:hypothetical protein